MVTIATGCKNYATESVHLLTNILYADLPWHLAYIAVHNWTVNVEGKPGRGKSINQMAERYILYVYYNYQCLFQDFAQEGANI